MYNIYGDNMDYLFVIAQICGALILLFDILCIISNNKKKILIYNTFTNIFTSLQYFFLKAFSGAFSIIITFLRNFIFSKYRNKNQKIPFYWLLIILILLIIFNVATYDGIISLIPLITILLYTIALWQNSIKNFRLLNMFIYSLSAIYNFYYQAYVGFIAQLIFILICAGSYSYNIKKTN